MISFKKYLKNNSIVYPLIIFILFVSYILCSLLNPTKKIKEGFGNNDIQTTITPYNPNYINFYSEYLHDDKRFQFEIKHLLRLLKKSNQYYNIKILDVGSGTGNHVKKLNDLGYDTIGIDSSLPMIEYSIDKNERYNKKFHHANVLTTSLFDYNVYTHITCYNYTFYYIKNKRRFFENCFGWLIDGGYLILTLVDKIEINSFDSGGDIALNGVKYSTNYEKRDKNKIIFTERLKYSDKTIRNEHVFYDIGNREIMELWRDVGFVERKKINMKSVGYPYHTIYVLQKEL